jgi:predicted AlkP superfamily phosphohydrolase/phosphomutase
VAAAKSRANNPRLVVVGLDGLPFTLAQRLLAEGYMPNLARIAGGGTFQQMDSVVPTVSSAAWTSFNTGVQPGKHGLYGFVHRHSDSYMVDICSTAIISRKLIPELVSEAGGAAFSMNVPVTTPPRKVNGVMIGCFLSNDLNRVAEPRSEAAYLKSMGYRIDTDPILARRSKRDMLSDIRVTTERRFDAALHYLEDRPWDWFHVHVMGTDRLNHFLFAKGLDGSAEFGRDFLECYRYIDAQLARLLDRLGDEVPLVLLSDHGFTKIKQEVQLSRWLVDQGWTVLGGGKVGHPFDFDPTRTRAYTVIPGQLFINLRCREPGGIVAPEDYQATRDELARDLLTLRDPQGNPVIRRVMKREEVFWPAGQRGPEPRMSQDRLLNGDPVFGRAPDLVALEHPGYDLKMGLAKTVTFETTELEGMHTTNDATLITRGLALPAGRPHLVGLAPLLLRQLGINPPDDLDDQVWNKEPL